MASINYGAKEISVKVVYYGPGLSGKTTNLQVIHQKVPKENKSTMVSLATETDRTLFFDFLPLDLGKIKGFNTKFQLYTVPGQVYYNATRKLVLRGVDGVVFVADSGANKAEENLESLQNLLDNLTEYGYNPDTIPLVIQYNKRDLPNALPVEAMHQQINQQNRPWTEAVAFKGKGVFETLKLIGKIVIDELNKKYSRPGTPGMSSPAPSRPTGSQPAVSTVAQGYAAQPAPVPPLPRAAAPAFNQAQSSPFEAQSFAQPSRMAAPPAPQNFQPQKFASQQDPFSQGQPPAPSQFSFNPSTVQQPQQPQTSSNAFGEVNFEFAPPPAPVAPPAPQRSQGMQSVDFGFNQPTQPAPFAAPSLPQQNTTGKSDLDMEIEKYQREIEEKQRATTMQPAIQAGMQFPAAMQQQPQGFGSMPTFDAPLQQMNPYAQQQRPTVQMPAQPQIPQQGFSNFDMGQPPQQSFAVNQGFGMQQPQQQASYQQPLQQQQFAQFDMNQPQRQHTPPMGMQISSQPQSATEDDSPMFFTSIDTDKTRRKPRKPVNPKDKPKGGFFNKFLGKKEADE